MEEIKSYVSSKKEFLKQMVAVKKEIGLAIVQVGDNPASNSYIKGKISDCNEIGVIPKLLKLEENISEEYLIGLIEHLNSIEDCTGIIVQLPLPKHIDVKRVQQVISPSKDVDGFNINSEFKPCTPLGVITYLTNNRYKFEGKKALVIGRSDIVGKPLAQMLLDKNCTVTIAHSKTSFGDLTHYIENADIVFTAINKIEYFNKDFAPFFEKVPTIIDIGLGRNEYGKLRGNLSAELVEHLKEKGNDVISGIGGVGLLTRLQLLANTIKAQPEYKRSKANERDTIETGTR